MRIRPLAQELGLLCVGRRISLDGHVRAEVDLESPVAAEAPVTLGTPVGLLRSIRFQVPALVQAAGASRARGRPLTFVGAQVHAEVTFPQEVDAAKSAAVELLVIVNRLVPTQPSLGRKSLPAHCTLEGLLRGLDWALRQALCGGLCWSDFGQAGLRTAGPEQALRSALRVTHVAAQQRTVPT